MAALARLLLLGVGVLNVGGEDRNAPCGRRGTSRVRPGPQLLLQIRGMLPGSLIYAVRITVASCA